MPNRRIVLVGSGDVALRALPWLLERYRVTATSRRPPSDASLRETGARVLRADLDHPATLGRLAALAHGARAILHLAPPPASGLLDTRTRHLLAAIAARRGRHNRQQGLHRQAGWQRGAHVTRPLMRLAARPPRLVYVSTTGVYGDCGGAQIDEARRLNPESARAQRRVDAERRLRGFARRGLIGLSILRAPGIYAADRLPLERLRRGDPLLHPAEDVFTNHIHADDLARIVCRAITHGGPLRAINACDDSDLRMGEWFDALADAAGLARAPRVSRDELAARVSPQMLSFMRESRRIANRRLKRELRLRLRYANVLDTLAGIAKPGDPA